MNNIEIRNLRKQLGNPFIDGIDKEQHLSCPICGSETIFGFEKQIKVGLIEEHLSCDNDHFWIESWVRVDDITKIMTKKEWEDSINIA
jgi:hypothetical protein